MHILFHCHKKIFLIIEMKLGHCITLQKTLRKQYYTISVVSNLFCMAILLSYLNFRGPPIILVNNKKDFT